MLPNFNSSKFRKTMFQFASGRDKFQIQTSNRSAWILVLAPILVKAPLLLGWLIADPMMLYSGLASGLHRGPFGGFPPLPTIDPNIAFTSHALGHRSALEILSGHIPWWNHYEGVGAPLVGEMQAAALFPLTWLLALHNGQLYEHIVLQIIAGLSTWALLRKLGCARFAALAGAIAFEFNGTFAWLANAVVNPIAFLPLTLYGIETLRDRANSKAAGGAAWMTIGLAASLYAGFPEVAYLNGLLILAWTLARVPSVAPTARAQFLLRIIVGGIAALAIAAPVLVPFADYLLVANSGGHQGDGFSIVSLNPAFLLTILIPYAFGGIFQQPIYGPFWGSVGGYAGCTLTAIALYGLFGRNLRGLRILLFVWAIVAIAISYGAPGTAILMKLIPAFKLTAFYRYLPPSWEFALCVLSALGLSDLASSFNKRRLLVVIALVACACLIAACVAHFNSFPLRSKFAIVNGLFLLGIFVVAVTVSCITMPSGRRVQCIAGLLIIETIMAFVVPVMSYPSRGTVELGGVTYLQQHIGMQRFTTLGPIQPNYGSYFGIASINHNDLPMPKDWTDYVEHHLDSNSPPILFTGTSRNDLQGPSAVDNLLKNIDAYRGTGVKYVLAPAHALDTPGMAALKYYVESNRQSGAHVVFEDSVMTIIELPAPAPYFDAPACRLASSSRDSVEAQCSKPSHLTRMELHMAGWTVAVNGREVPIEHTSEIFQRVPLPQGKSTVEFDFTPPYIVWAYAAFCAGALLLAWDIVRSRKRQFSVSS
ncbi:YfhO family protein [Paraburkholderia sacchari]|uniref:YfhO family protein n=1 Tax=Paraburkholderia sacchari TaxID=159450 RepID=UPI003D99627D